MNPKTKMIAVCGIDCESCNIRRAPHDPEAAAQIVAWFRREGWLQEDEGIAEIIDKSMYCTGCRGDRSIHWTPDCEILTCCVDEKGLEYCSQCTSFPCDKLTHRAEKNDHYKKALQRLKNMKEDLKKN